MGQIIGSEAGQVRIPGMIPYHLNRIRVRRIGRQPLHLQSIRMLRLKMANRFPVRPQMIRDHDIPVPQVEMQPILEERNSRIPADVLR